MVRKKHTIAALLGSAVAVLAACALNPPPQRARAFWVDCAQDGAAAVIDIDPPESQHAVSTCTAGRLTFALPPSTPLSFGSVISVSADGFASFRARAKTPASTVGALEIHELYSDALLPGPITLKTARVSAGESGRLTAHDRQFWTEDGQPWTWAGMSDFLLFARYLDGQDIRPQLDQRVALGAKVLRIFGMVDAFSRSRPEAFAHFYPLEHADYYEQLTQFVLLANSYGLRVEFTLFADAKAVMPDRATQDAYAEQVFLAIERASIASGLSNFEEGCNECMFEDNLPGGEARAFEVMKRFQGRSPFVLVASGAYAIATCAASFPALDYFTDHNDRGDEWVRKTIDLREHRDGFQWSERDCGANAGSFRGVQVPAVGDEPRGLDEFVWGSRTTDTVAAGQTGGMAALMGNGVTCHSQSGLLSELLGPVQAAGCKAMLAAARFIPPQVQTLNYARGSDQGPCTWAYGPGPVEHDEGPGKRSFNKWIGSDQWIVQAGSTRPTVTACPGFTLVDEPVQGVAHLRQQ